MSFSYGSSLRIHGLKYYSGDDVFKSAGYLTEAIVDPATTSSSEPTQAPFHRGHNTDASFFSWLEDPENADKLSRYAVGMNGLKNMSMPGAVLQGTCDSHRIESQSSGRVVGSLDFDWTALPEHSLVVDVGGGIGSKSLTLAEAFPHLKFVVQDRAAVITDSAPKVCVEL